MPVCRAALWGRPRACLARAPPRGSPSGFAPTAMLDNRECACAEGAPGVGPTRRADAWGSRLRPPPPWHPDPLVSVPPPVPPAWVASAGRECPRAPSLRPRLRALPVGTAPEGVPCSPPRAPRRAPDHSLWHGALRLAPLCPPPATAATSTAHGTSRPRAPCKEAPAASGRSPSVAECKCPSCSDPGPPHLPESLAKRPLLRGRSLPFTWLPHALAPVIRVGLVK